MVTINSRVKILATSLAAALALTACSPPTTYEEVRGVGFEDYDTYQRSREAQLRGQRVPADTSAEVTPVLPPEGGSEEGIIRAERPNQPPRDNVRISDEQDFGAVSGRESIESDAERIAQNRQQYEVVQPTRLPQRTGSGGPNIVEFALATNNAVGEKVHNRSAILAGNRFDRNCSQYASQDLAQEAFLKAGGPERDRLGLDPDGDGFACYWDPTPFRAARRAIDG